jgi:hypothetical protein
VGRSVAGLLVAATLSGLLTTTGCGLVPARPDPASWRDTASTALDDAVALVGTASMVLREEGRQHVLGGYGVATLVHAEDAMGKAVDSVDKLQPPASLDKEASAVSDLLAQADDAVQAAREALVSGDTAAYPRLRQRLETLHDRLKKAGGSL